ncbi:MULTISPECIES: hypothetical protein [unclassified Bartonella]|uniref:hypothetical protein n=1 Tax=unclassified Bartonella TaxID=2645622 RepID=UPI0035CFC2CE
MIKVFLLLQYYRLLLQSGTLFNYLYITKEWKYLLIDFTLDSVLTDFSVHEKK